jgi:hypothetical protein
MMGLSLPERRPDRSARHAVRRRKRRFKAALVTVGLAASLAAVTAVVRAAPYLRRYGIHVPYIPHPLQMAILLITVVFVAGQVTLLILAIATVGKESHDRYLNLMLQWPFVLVAPYVIAKRRALPDRYFGQDGQHRSGSPQNRESDQGSQADPITLEQYRSALRLAMGQLPDRSRLTPDQYRSALRVAMDEVSSLRMDRDLQELLMRQLESLEIRGSADADAPEREQ